MVYAAKQGDLQTFGVGHSRYSLPQVIAWSRKKWPDELHDFHAEHSGAATSTLVISDSACSFVTPGDLPRCQEALEGAQREILHLRGQLKAARTEIQRLIPIAEKYEHICKGNTRSAKLPRKGAL